MSLRYDLPSMLTLLRKEIDQNWTKTIKPLTPGFRITTQPTSYKIELHWFTALGSQQVECLVSNDLINHHPQIFYFIIQQLSFKVKYHKPVRRAVKTQGYAFDSAFAEDI